MKPLASLIVLALITAPASAQFAMSPQPAEAGEDNRLVTAANPAAVAALLRDKGYKAELETQPSGAVVIQTQSRDAGFGLYFQACTDTFTECEVITFSAGFDFETAQLPDILGRWNATRFSKAYLNEEGDPFVEFSINMKHGVTAENFIDSLVWFTTEIAAFIDQIGWTGDMEDHTQPI